MAPLKKIDNNAPYRFQSHLTVSKFSLPYKGPSPVHKIHKLLSKVGLREADIDADERDWILPASGGPFCLSRSPNMRPVSFADFQPPQSSSPKKVIAGSLLYLSQSTLQSLADTPSTGGWTTCHAELIDRKLILKWSSPELLWCERKIDLNDCSNIRSFGITQLRGEEANALLMKRPEGQAYLFEVVLSKEIEKFAATSFQEQGVWISAIWETILPTGDGLNRNWDGTVESEYESDVFLDAPTSKSRKVNPRKRPPTPYRHTANKSNTLRSLASWPPASPQSSPPSVLEPRGTSSNLLPEAGSSARPRASEYKILPASKSVPAFVASAPSRNRDITSKDLVRCTISKKQAENVKPKPSIDDARLADSFSSSPPYVKLASARPKIKKIAYIPPVPQVARPPSNDLEFRAEDPLGRLMECSPSDRTGAADRTDQPSQYSSNADNPTLFEVYSNTVHLEDQIGQLENHLMRIEEMLLRIEHKLGTSPKSDFSFGFMTRTNTQEDKQIINQCNESNEVLPNSSAPFSDGSELSNADLCNVLDELDASFNIQNNKKF
ncbi:hypothetical protein BDQ12DRAFT_708305 [Crucibulum laeve]|uniref:PH domain-containing protein n=1 Tax=Crucibulum laeve TaxID=68775 RepID=A0A5C3MSL5_9AGAR|nr:hypothetical protein BDQ12DRAFT_708305 [Crucibulum laeve]